MRETTAVVVVTYNRKDLLIECLEALRNQIHQPDAIYIIDNLSTDGTPELLLEKKYIPLLPNCDLKENQLINYKISSILKPEESIKIIYLRKFENDGGAGGFYIGMKLAYEDGFDWIWCMDDDVEPKSDCLQLLMNDSNRYKVIVPLRVNRQIEIDEYACAEIKANNFFSKKAKLIPIKDIYGLKNIPESLVLYNFSFEGPIFHKSIIEKVGLPIKEFFYYYDDTEYALRIKKVLKISPVLITGARIIRKMIITQQNITDLKLFYIIRNNFFILNFYGKNMFLRLRPYYVIILVLIKNILSFNFNRASIALKAFKDYQIKKNIIYFNYFKNIDFK